MLSPDRFLATLASPRRREILRLAWDGERAAGDIHRAMPDVTFGAVSLHLRTLVEAGLLEARADGRRRFYRARRDVLGPVAAWLESMWNDALWSLKLQAELEHSRRGPRGNATTRRSPHGGRRAPSGAQPARASRKSPARAGQKGSRK